VSAQDHGWAEGFISAYNELVWPRKDILASTDVQGMLGWIDNYCTAHPEESLSTAMDTFINEMKAKPHTATN
jgi:hypothetical protein